MRYCRLGSVASFLCAFLFSSFALAYIPGEPLEEWRTFASKKYASEWSKIKKTDRRYFVDCFTTYCSVIDFDRSLLSVVAEGRTEKMALQNFRTTLYNALYTHSDWKHIMIAGETPKTLKKFTEIIDLQSPSAIPFEAGFVISKTYPFAPEFYNQRKARHDKYIQHYAKQYDLDVHFLSVFVEVSSNHNPYAKTYSGHQGLMLLHPEESAPLAIETVSGIYRKPTQLELLMPGTNIQWGASLLADLYKHYSYVDDYKARTLCVLLAYFSSRNEVDLKFRPEASSTYQKIKYQIPVSSRLSVYMMHEFAEDSRLFE